jgi:hypothetical protein
MNHRLITAACAGLAAAITLGGCGSMAVSEKSDRIRLISDPPGATAYADGGEIGNTPLTIDPGEHFRSGFVGLTYRYFGKLSFKKPGCAPYTIEVDDAVLAKDVHARLKCDPDYRPASTGEKGTPAGGDRYAERLERIESLHKKGLISDEEYQRLRKRILDEL